MTLSIYLKPMRCIGKKENETALPPAGDSFIFRRWAGKMKKK